MEEREANIPGEESERRLKEGKERSEEVKRRPGQEQSQSGSVGEEKESNY